MNAPALRLSLGPIPYYWPRDKVLAFYREAASWPVDIVYLGETVCTRRREVRLADWLELGDMLEAAGKEVALSTLELTETEADLRAVRSVVRNGRFRIEANDMGAVHLLEGQPFVAGPFLNVYHADTLAIMREAGAVRWVPPVEMSGKSLRALVDAGGDRLECEVFAYGHAPLAVSSRCFTARYYNLSKDHCEFRCIDHPEGLLVSTQEDVPFLVLNGVQTQSALVVSLVRELREAAAMGVDIFRITPQPEGTGRVVELFHAVARGTISGEQAALKMAASQPYPTCQGYWHGEAGMTSVQLREGASA
jgi:collagenase-like PrtC family protease